MGQEIVYCCRCQTQLRSRDFEKGTALRLESRACCASCAPEVLKSLPPETARALLQQAVAARSSKKSSETSRITAQVPATSSRVAPAAPEPSSFGGTGVVVAGLAGLV